MKKYVQIFFQYFSYSIQVALEYRSDLIIWTVISLCWTFFNLLVYEILFLNSPVIGGWTKEQTYALAGTAMILDYFLWGIMYRIMNEYSKAIYTGSLDYLLLKPLDPQVHLSVTRWGFSNLNRLIIGIFLVIKFSQITSFWNIPLYIICLFASLLAIYALWFFTVTLTFYVEKADNLNEIVPVLKRIWSVPSEMFQGIVGTILTTIIPLALISTTPTHAMFGMFAWKEMIIFFGFAIISFAASRKFFLHAIRSYTSIGS